MKPSSTLKFPNVVVLIMRKRKEMPRWIPSRGIFDQVVGIFESTELAQEYMAELYRPEVNDLYIITEPVHRSGDVVAKNKRQSQRMKEYWRLKKQAEA